MTKLEAILALLKDEGTAAEQPQEVYFAGSKVKIAILQRGWVFVGKFEQDGQLCTLRDAKNIRTWGTTKGLGELASDGPTSSTKLDPVNDVSFHVLTSVAIIDCDDKIWSKAL